MKRIPLTQGKVALIDDSDYERINKYKWCACKMGKKFYAYRGQYLGVHLITGKEINKSVSMAREIMNCPKGYEVDHINGDSLDNQRSNLRVCTHQENIQNRIKYTSCTSKYKGVSYRKDLVKEGNSWRATIHLRDVFNQAFQKSLGSYETEIDAAIAYDKAATQEWGQFAKLNLGGQNEITPLR